MTCASRLRRLPTLLVAVGLLALLAQAIAPPSRLPDATTDLRGLPTGLIGGLVGTVSGLVAPTPSHGACDVDGVRVSYRTAYRDQSPLGYDVTDAVVSEIAWPSCNGAMLTVTLGDGTTPARARGHVTLSSTNVTVSGGGGTTSVPVRLSSGPTVPPDAAWVSTVGVTLEGGTTPTPVECSGMWFSRTVVGTNGDDKIQGATLASDLIFTLLGADRIDSGEGNDCVITGADAQGDSVTLGLGNSVAVTGAGADTINAGITVLKITVGVGKYKVISGAGNDTIAVGAGIGSFVDAGPGTDTCRVSPLALQITIVNCEHRVKL